MRKKKYSKEELIKKLQEEALFLKRVPISKDMDLASKEGRGAAGTVYRSYFGKFNHALIIAGLKVNRASKYKKGKLISDLQKVYGLLRRLPTTEELTGFHKSNLMAERSVYCDAFGTMKGAYIAAGIDLNAEKISCEERRRIKLISQLKNLSVGEKENLDITNAIILHKKGKIAGLSIFVKMFGSWTKALEAAGIEPGRKIYSDEELISILKSEHESTNETPTFEYFAEMSKCGLLPSPNTYRYHFQTWENALSAAGITNKEKACCI